MVHGIVDVPGQKIGIVLSGILLASISIKPNYHKDRITPKITIYIYQFLAVGLFSLGLILIHSQWFSFNSIIFSNTQTKMDKIQNLYELSIDSARVKDVDNQKKYMWLLR